MERLRTKLTEWDLPQGPFISYEDIYHDMDLEAQRLGADAATELIATFITLETEQDPQVDVLGEFLNIYSEHYPDELHQALLAQLTPTSSPWFIALLGSSGHSDIVKKLMNTLDLGTASDDLLQSYISVLSYIGGEESISALQKLLQRPKLSEQVHNNITKTIDTLGSK